VSGLSLLTDLVDAARRVGTDVAAPHAESVDREARFPHEALAALREERMLSVLVPIELGGRGATIAEVAAACETLGRYCSSTAMIYAMHQIEVACLVRHGLAVPYFRRYLSELVEREWLIASATSEVGVGGDLRRSACAVERDGHVFMVKKQAPVISYGAEADDILMTARRDADAAPGDQVLVLVRKGDTRLSPMGIWDTLGMRGTRSLGFTLEATGSVDQILPVPFSDIASQTMLPTSHVLWTSLWLGLTSDAVNRARAFVRAEARKAPGTTPPGALRLAETVAALGTMRATVHEGLADYARHQDNHEVLAGMAFAIRMNNLKASTAQMAPEIVGRALGICGVSGYRYDSPYTVGRHLRDAHSAALMISNDRVFAANAAMLLVHKEEA
jgi:acyl-CoA dehydrogenase